MKRRHSENRKGFARTYETVSRICSLVVLVLWSGATVGCGNSISLGKAASEYRAAQERDAIARAFNSVEEMEANEELRESKLERKDIRRH